MLKKVFVLMICLIFCLGCKEKAMQDPRVELKYFKDNNCYIGSISNFPVDRKYILYSTFSVFWKIDGKINQIDIPSAPLLLTYSETNNKILVAAMKGVYEISPQASELTEIELPVKPFFNFGISSRPGYEIFACGSEGMDDLCVYYNCLTGRIKRINTSSSVRGASFSDSKVFFNTEQNIFQYNIGLSALTESGKTRKPLSRIKGSWDDTPILFLEEDDEKSFLYWSDAAVEFQCFLKFVGCNGDFLWVIDCDNQIYRIAKNASKELVDEIDPGATGFGMLDNGMWVSFPDGKVISYTNEGIKNKVFLDLPFIE